MISGELFNGIYQTVFILSIISFLIGIIFIKSHNRKDFIILFYLFLSITFDLISDNALKLFGDPRNTHIGNSWSIVEFLLFVYFFHLTKRINKYFQIIFVILFIVICYYTFSYIISFYQLTNVHKLTSAIYFSSISIYLFYTFLKNANERLMQTSLFWQNTGVFIYFTGNIIIFLLFDFYYSEEKQFWLSALSFEYWRLSWSIHNILTFIKSLCFVIGFYMNYKYMSINKA